MQNDASDKVFWSPKFWPLFWTQALGALNDNIFKNALVILVTFNVAYTVEGMAPEKLVAIASGIFIFPFFLFSATAGQIADRYPKSKVMFWVKIWEVLVMIVGGIGFFTDNVALLFVTLFMMGLQSSFFGPVKYGILPELLSKKQMVAGNAYVEVGTFLAILVGTILATWLVSEPYQAVFVVAIVLFVSVLGVFTASKVPYQAAADPSLKVQYSVIAPTIRIIKITAKIKSVFLSVLAISWFWLLGACFLSLFPPYCKDLLNSDQTVVGFFLALFSVGVGIGSIACEKLSFRQLELGLVPIGSFGISLFAFDLFLLGTPGFVSSEVQTTIATIVTHPDGWRLIADLTLFSLFSGLFIVPLYTFIQERADADSRSRVIAGNNVMNALFMVIGSFLLTLSFSYGLTIPQIFLMLAVLNVIVAIYVYTVLPEFLFRFMCWTLAHVLYRLKVLNLERIPEKGAAVLVANHVSFIDWLIIASSTQRPMRFVMHYSFANAPLLGGFFRRAKVIPIAGSKENSEILEAAFEQISKELRDGEMVCIFPEGRITHDGQLAAFRPGIERILKKDPVTVVPLKLNGLWGSFFSRKHGGKALTKPFSRFWSRISVQVGEPMAPEGLTADSLYEVVKKL